VAHQYKQHPSPTGHLIGGQLVPVPEAVAATETVWLVLTDEPRFRLRLRKDTIWEGLAAEATEAKDRVVVRAVPLFAYDVNYGDELSVVTSAEGSLVATGISKDAGNHTFRAWLREDTGDDEVRDVVTQFGALGCLIEGYSDRLIGLSCSPVNAHEVADALEMAGQEGRFTYETGRQRTS
jgi:Domain of unknown function (DUF4265)